MAAIAPRSRGTWFVVGQFVLLGLLIVVPSLTSWLPGGGGEIEVGWLRPLGYLLLGLGLVVVAVAGLHLGDALTALPEPRDDAELRTGGLYALARHPIYAGVLLVGWGLGLRSQLVVGLVLALALAVLIGAKARYEEQLLHARHDGYHAYAKTTPRYLPRPWRRRPR